MSNSTIVFTCTELAEKIQSLAKKAAENFATQSKRMPCLAVVLVGDDPASHVYVKKKSAQCAANALLAKDYILAADTSEADLIKILTNLNDDPAIDGILVQSPLPSHLNERKIQSLIHPNKDVDGFHPENAGALLIDTKKCLAQGLPPCTPAGVMEVFKENKIHLAGKHAVVIGRSTIVGKPMALMLLSENATVTICHSQTKNLSQECARADIIIAAVGKAQLVNKSFLKAGAVVIDVGINRTQFNGKIKLLGDVNADDCIGTASFITPVPKGIGPLTIAMLIRNTVRAAHRHSNLDSPI